MRYICWNIFCEFFEISFNVKDKSYKKVILSKRDFKLQTGSLGKESCIYKGGGGGGGLELTSISLRSLGNSLTFNDELGNFIVHGPSTPTTPLFMDYS